ncbi:hypothetical protein [Streptomyces mirabilis]
MRTPLSAIRGCLRRHRHGHHDRHDRHHERHHGGRRSLR